MRPFVIVIILFITLGVNAETIVQLTLQYKSGVLSEVAQKKVELKRKRSRSQSRGGRGGAASSWFWRSFDSGGEIQSEEYFADPTFICTGDHSRHIVLDSTEFTISVPRVEGGEIRVFRDVEGESVLVGGTVAHKRTVFPLLTIPMKGDE